MTLQRKEAETQATREGPPALDDYAADTENPPKPPSEQKKTASVIVDDDNEVWFFFKKAKKPCGADVTLCNWSKCRGLTVDPKKRTGQFNYTFKKGVNKMVPQYSNMWNHLVSDHKEDFQSRGDARAYAKARIGTGSKGKPKKDLSMVSSYQSVSLHRTNKQ